MTNPANPVLIWPSSQFFFGFFSYSISFPSDHFYHWILFLPTENLFTSDNYPSTSVADYFCLKNISVEHFLFSILFIPLWCIFKFSLQYIIPFRLLLTTKNIFTTDNFPTTSVTDYFCLNSTSTYYFPLRIFCSVSYSFPSGVFLNYFPLQNIF